MEEENLKLNQEEEKGTQMNVPEEVKETQMNAPEEVKDEFQNEGLEGKVKKENRFKKETIIGTILGFIVGLLIMYIIASTILSNSVRGKLATINGKDYNEEDYYDMLKKNYSIEYLLSKELDPLVFDNIYTLTDSEETYVEEQADKYINYYVAYGYTEKEFFEMNDCKDRDDFIDLIASNYKATKYYYEYLEDTLEDGEVEAYYEENKETVDKYDSEHILVEITDEVTEEQALTLANEIIAKLDAGKSFEDVAEEYEDQVVHEELGYTNAESGLEETYSTALEEIEDGTYTQTPVLTSYGYHIIYRISTTTLDDITTRFDIIDILTEDLQLSDSNLYHKVFIEMREKYGLKFYDEDLEKAYEDYCESYLD